MSRTQCAIVFMLCLFAAVDLTAQERPYFVTYSHEMEEPGNLDIEAFSVVGKPPVGNRFLGSNLEFEYGARAWWTTEFYLDGQATQDDSAIYTGLRWENRLRPLLREHRINPVLYVEFEDINGADKALREVVGHDGKQDFVDRNSSTHTEKKREVETKLILGSNFHGWNASENFIAEKNLGGGPWEFGYSIAASRPLGLAASAHNCTFCKEKVQAGIEMYGGLGDRYSLGTRLTSQYLGPAMNWQSSSGITFSFSPQFGLNDYSIPRLYRFGVAYEIDQFLDHFHRHRGNAG